MKYLIVGLGNIGAKYDNTRHNIGFEVLDYLIKDYEDVNFETKRLAQVCELKHKGRTLLLAKPTTYMNLSGKAVRYWMKQEKIKPENILVVLDDLNLDFGAIRLRGKGSHGGHNGLKDIDACLGNNHYARLRFGIGSDYTKGKQVNYVLGEWSSKEQESLPLLLAHCSEAIKSFATAGLVHTMSQYNKKADSL